ncbi:MAG: hypothetical protein MUC65_01960 [Pontiellaceae bacterium]|nr:hypothetical protein [Pontiellaceae bacterium]
MKKTGMGWLGIAVLLMAGCVTDEVTPVRWKEKSAYAEKVKDPRQYGYSIYQTPRGIEYRGGMSLRANQAKTLPMDVEEPFRPVVMMSGKFGEKEPVLLDFTINASWMEFGLAKDLHAVPADERAAQWVNFSSKNFPDCLSLIPRVRLGGIVIGNPLFYVRMANGPMGSMARGIEKPQIRAVVGWDILKKFEQIFLNYEEGVMALSTTKMSYNPDPAGVIAKLSLVEHSGACVVRGTVDGKSTLVLIDPAGDFDVATDSGQPFKALQLDEGFVFSEPAVSKSSGGTRIGAKLLKNYRVTVCPQEGLVYFEKPGVEEE